MVHHVSTPCELEPVPFIPPSNQYVVAPVLRRATPAAQKGVAPDNDSWAFPNSIAFRPRNFFGVTLTVRAVCCR
jgi:hypothetical protein